MRKLVALGVSLAILCVIYWQVDPAAILAALAAADGPLLVLGLAMVIPITAATAWRLTVLAPGGAIGFWRALRLTLMASVLNLVLPSKMGDISKAYAIAERGHMSGPGALALVVFEKGWDMLALLVWCLFGLVFLGAEQAIFLVLAAAVALALLAGIALTVSPRAAGQLLRIGGRFAPAKLGRWLGAFADSWGEVLTHVWARPGRGATVVLGSVALWFLHLFQIWLFALALAATIPLIENLARAALSILVGLLPFTLAGIGTRDAALIFFYQPHMTVQAAAALGLLCTLRYLLPALAGLPLLGLYVNEIRREA